MTVFLVLLFFMLKIFSPVFYFQVKITFCSTNIVDTNGIKFDIFVKMYMFMSSLDNMRTYKEDQYTIFSSRVSPKE